MSSPRTGGRAHASPDLDAPDLDASDSARRVILWSAVLAMAAAGFAIAGALAAGSPIPQLEPQPSRHGDPPMRIVRVTSSDKACEPDCPEWISAEGMITPGTAAASPSSSPSLGGRRLPVLISSHGGSVRDALEMGVADSRRRASRSRSARTLDRELPGAGARLPECAGPRDGPAAPSAPRPARWCSPGGVERLVGPAPLIGVHQITTVLRETEGVDRLDQDRQDLRAGLGRPDGRGLPGPAGVGEPVMTFCARRRPRASTG